MEYQMIPENLEPFDTVYVEALTRDHYRRAKLQELAVNLPIPDDICAAAAMVDAFIETDRQWYANLEAVAAKHNMQVRTFAPDGVEWVPYHDARPLLCPACQQADCIGHEDYIKEAHSTTTGGLHILVLKMLGAL
jgi:hypothetical protein